MSRFGRLDGAVNNAGKSAATSIAGSSDEAWREDYELKVIAALTSRVESLMPWRSPKDPSSTSWPSWPARREAVLLRRPRRGQRGWL